MNVRQEMNERTVLISVREEMTLDTSTIYEHCNQQVSLLQFCII